MKLVRHGNLIDRIEELWAENGAPLHDYKAGSMGPQASFDLLENSVPNGLGNQISPIVKMVV